MAFSINCDFRNICKKFCLKKQHINALNVTSLFSRNSNFTSHLKMHFEEKQNTFLIKHITAVNVTSPFQGIVILQVISKYILGRNQISAM